MTKNKVINLETKEIIFDDYEYLLEEGELLFESQESYEGKKVFYCNKNFIGELQDEESERLLKQLIIDLVNLAKIDNLGIKFLFVSDAIKLYDFIKSECALLGEDEKSKNNVKFYFSEDSLEYFMSEKISEISNLESRNIEVISSRAIASLLMISDVVTLT